ncbi:hypothetical protein BVC80_1717g9 [Macleaya cordata]|uniref:Uncharacterized protein n=1 Tax=Macleaya cordata TaxID=56857 RepID=A0A200Q1V5_MACCD|nr:hypothetical protein BVC80_1717g9 [Macleaya cordata]
MSDDIDENTSIDEIKAPSVFGRAKEEIEALVEAIHPKKKESETHGLSNDIDENTPIDEIKAPGVFERAKEEIEALVEAIHPKKKESENHDSSSKKEGGFVASIGRNFEKICSPRDKK